MLGISLANIDQVTILSISFMLLFTSFNTCQNFAAKVLRDAGFDDLGFLSIATLYFTFAIVSFFGTAIVNKIGSP